jgi:hypothetical protein
MMTEGVVVNREEIRKAGGIVIVVETAHILLPKADSQ